MTGGGEYFLDLPVLYSVLLDLPRLKVRIDMPIHSRCSQFCIPLDHAQVCRGIMRCSKSTKPALLINSGKRSGARRSLISFKLSIYLVLHSRKAWSVYQSAPTPQCMLVCSVSPTLGECTIVGLTIVVYLNHLAPSSRPRDAKYISQVRWPAIPIYASCHELAMDKIERIRREGKSSDSLAKFRLHSWLRVTVD